MEIEKEKRKRFFIDRLPITILAFLFLIMLSSYGTIVFFPILDKLSATNEGLYVVVYYASSITEWVAFLLALLVIKKDHVFFKKIIPGKGNNTFKNAVIGAALGFGLNGVCILLAWLNKDIFLYLEPDDIWIVLLSFIAVFIQSSAEEFFSRVWLYQHLKRGYKSELVAIITSSVIFSVLHIFNGGLTAVGLISIAAAGLLFSLCIYYFDSFIMCAMAHTLWNFTQNIIFGLPNSGIVLPLSIFKLDASNARNSFFYDVGFGIEGSIMAIVALATACVVIIFIGKKKNTREMI